MAAHVVELADRLERRSLRRQEQLEGKTPSSKKRGCSTQEPTCNGGVRGTQGYFAERHALNTKASALKG
jgi:hypothetical protein